MTRSVLAFLATAGLVAAQGVTDKISPKGDAPATCKPSWDGNFELTVASVVSKRDIAPRGACGGTGTLVLTLADGVLLDAESRTGYIASNYQFQFDKPAQAGAIYTAGFSVCGNGSLALGPSAVFYKCTSGDFSNLYDRSWAPQCSPVELIAMPCGGNVGQGGDGQVGQGADGQVGQGSDGQIIGTTMIQTTVVSVLSDGQPQVKTTAVPLALCQITDGQAQVKTTPCASVTSAPAKTTAKPAPVSQYSDGQIQVTPGPAPPAPAPAAPAPAPAAPAPAPAAPAPAPAPAPASAPAPAPVSSAGSSSAAPAKTTAAPASTTSAPAVKSSSPVSASGAGQLEMASVSALVVGIVGAIFFL